eukprot:s250_g10.t1
MFPLSSQPSFFDEGRESLSHGHFGSFTFCTRSTAADFARFYIDSTAHPWWDCDNGSGPTQLAEPANSLAWEWPSLHVPSAAHFDSGRAFRQQSKWYPCGEAFNPGPPLNISFGNPTGLRGKESVLYNMAKGIQNLGETHLATPGRQAACGMLRAWARNDNHRFRLLPGAPMPLRARSFTTGVWSGVWQSADVPCSRLALQWPQDEFRLGRAQAATFQVGQSHILGVLLYAWSPGPTWPKAKEANRILLSYLTNEVVLGSRGCRYICGDFNGTEEDYPELRQWLDAGWIEIQTLQQARSGDPIYPTCKGVYEPQQRQPQAPTLRPSRQSEEAPSSDFICRSLQRWFTQLRRMQSLLHNVRRGSDQLAALAYRLRTWQAIKTARGFSGSFAAWWALRPIKHQGVGDILPTLVPSASVLEGLYDDFKANYRSLEAWNMRHRAATLKLAAREDTKTAFRAILGDAESQAIDSFEDRQAAMVLAVDAATGQVHTDVDIAPQAAASWTLDDEPAEVAKVDRCIFTVDSDRLLCPGQELMQSVTTLPPPGTYGTYKLLKEVIWKLS